MRAVIMEESDCLKRLASRTENGTEIPRFSLLQSSDLLLISSTGLSEAGQPESLGERCHLKVSFSGHRTGNEGQKWMRWVGWNVVREARGE